MAEAAQMERPGVEVIQEFVATTPTILRPSLQPCIVGPCRQVVEAIADDGSLVTQSRVRAPARLTTPFVTDPFEYVGVAGGQLLISVNNGPAREVLFLAQASAATPAKVVDAVLTAGISGLTARLEVSGDQQRAVIETTARGGLSSLKVSQGTTTEVATAFQWPIGYVTRGFDGYDNQQNLRLQASDLPDPRTNNADLVLDHDSVRVFISPGGGSPLEVSRREALVQGAASDVTVADDGDGDALSPYVELEDADFGAGPSVAAVTGGDLAGVTWTDVQGKALRLAVDGEPYQTVVFGPTVAAAADLVSAINAVFPGVASEAGGALVLTSSSDFGGLESTVSIDKDASSTELLDALGLTGTGAPFETSSSVSGDGYAPEVGDELWVDGIQIGSIVEVLTAPANRLRIDTEQLLTFTGTSWLIKAKDLDNAAASATRPGSNLQVDSDTGSILIKPGLITTTAGGAVQASELPVYVAYDALRLDVTPAKGAGDFNLLRVGSLSQLEEALSPIDTQNPLGLGLYFAMLNAPGLEVTGCGVDEADESAPEGTVDAYARSLEFLESKDIYTIVPLTYSSEVGSIAALHADVMSEPSTGLERIVIVTPRRPTRRSDTMVASGPRANIVGPPTDTVQTGIANLQAALATAGKPGPMFTEQDGVFIRFESDRNAYLVESVTGGTLAINNGPLTNTDGFFYDGGGQPVFEEMVVDRPFSIFVRGAALLNRTDEAAAYGDYGRGYRNKRVICVAPDTVKATLDGLETAIPGYYAAAALAGRKASKNPSQPLTEDALAGFSGVVGSQERYSEPQLRMLCGGGVWVLYQESDGQPIRTRHQLTTDVSQLLTRESSITDALDYSAKTLRQTFRNFVGRFNVTVGLIEALNLVCDGVADFFLQNDIFSSFQVVEIKQNVNNPDELSVVVDVITLKPLNKIRITMRVT